jgi:hypothetical protein
MSNPIFFGILVLATLCCVSGCSGEKPGSGEFVDFRDTEADATTAVGEQEQPSQDVAPAATELADTTPQVEPVAGETVADTGSTPAADSDPEAGTPEKASAGTEVEGDAELASQSTSPPVEPDSAVADPAIKTLPNQLPGGLSEAQLELARLMEERAALLGGGVGASVEDEAPVEPREIELLIPQKQFRRERGTNAVRVSYDDIDLLKVLNMEPVPTDAVDHFPDWLSQLDGMPIRIRGFMFPTYEATGITRFTLARDNGICCFVRKPKIYDIIDVQLAAGEESDYIEGRPFDVEGVFRIAPEADEKELYRLYRIENAKVLR